MSKPEPVRKDHWVPDELRSKCQFEQCSVVFDLKNWRHHCWRCGEIFCDAHVAQKIRLAADAVPDPEGQWCPVCPRCFSESRKQEIGVVHDRTSSFRRARHIVAGARATAVAKAVRTLKELSRNPDDPEHERRVANWADESLVPVCMQCGAKFGLMKRKHHCRLCGGVFCYYCVSNTVQLGRSVLNPRGPDISAEIRVCSLCYEVVSSREKQLKIRKELSTQSAEITTLIEQIGAVRVRLQDKLELFENAVKGLVGWHGNGGQFQRSVSLEQDITELLKKYEGLAKDVLTRIAAMTDAPATFQHNVKKALIEYVQERIRQLRIQQRALRDYELSSIARIYEMVVVLHTLCREHNDAALMSEIAQGVQQMKPELLDCVLKSKLTWETYQEQLKTSIARRLRKQHNVLAQMAAVEITDVAAKLVDEIFTILRESLGEKLFPKTQSFIVTLKRTITTRRYERQRQVARKWRGGEQKVLSKKATVEQDGDSDDDHPAPARAAPPPSANGQYATVPAPVPAVPVPTVVKPTVSPPTGGFGSRLASAFAGVFNKVASVVEEPSPPVRRARSASVQSDQRPSPSTPAVRPVAEEQRKQAPTAKRAQQT